MFPKKIREEPKMAETAQKIGERLKAQEEARKHLMTAISAYEKESGIPLGSIRILRRNGTAINFVAQSR